MRRARGVRLVGDCPSGRAPWARPLEGVLLPEAQQGMPLSGRHSSPRRCRLSEPLSACAGGEIGWSAGVVTRQGHSTRWYKLGCFKQALLTLVHLRKNETFSQLGAGFGIPQPTTWRYVDETLDVLAGWAPGLQEALTGLGESSPVRVTAAASCRPTSVPSSAWSTFAGTTRSHSSPLASGYSSAPPTPTSRPSSIAWPAGRPVSAGPARDRPGLRPARRGARRVRPGQRQPGRLLAEAPPSRCERAGRGRPHGQAAVDLARAARPHP